MKNPYDNRLDLYRAYIAAKRAEAEAKAKSDELKMAVLNELFTEEKNEVVIDGSKFTIGSRPTWEFSPAIQQLEERLKAMKKLEQADGSATKLSEGNHVKLTLAKDEPKERFTAKPKTKTEMVDNSTGEISLAEEHESPFA